MADGTPTPGVLGTPETLMTELAELDPDGYARVVRSAKQLLARGPVTCPECGITSPGPAAWRAHVGEAARLHAALEVAAAAIEPLYGLLADVERLLPPAAAATDELFKAYGEHLDDDERNALIEDFAPLHEALHLADLIAWRAGRLSHADQNGEPADWHLADLCERYLPRAAS